MENHRPESTDEQLEDHSLPGTNMAGKGPGDECEHEDALKKRKLEKQENGKTADSKATDEKPPAPE